MILYGDPPVYLAQPTLQVLQWVRANISPTDVYDFQRQLWPGYHRQRLTFPGQKRIRPVVPNSLYWPSGASRFAVGYFFVAKSDLATLRQQARSGPTSYDLQALPFQMDDGTGVPLKCDLFMLPARPLADIQQWGGDKEDGLYLLTLVDERYFWWEKSTHEMVVQPANPQISIQTLTTSTLAAQDATTVNLSTTLDHSISSGTTLTFDSPGMDQPVSATLVNMASQGSNTLSVEPLVAQINASATSNYPDLGTQWIDLYAMCSNNLDVLIDVDPIADAYLVPSTEITARYQYTPLILDAIAYNVGQRIVRRLNGSVAAVNVDTAIADLQQNLRNGGSPQAGALFAFDNINPPTDLPSILPAFLDMVFFTVRDSKEQSCPAYPIEWQLNSLGIVEYAGIYGHNGVKTFHNTAALAYDTVGNPLNRTELALLSKQFAIDWYRWQQGNMDIQWAGIFIPTMTPLLDSVEWIYRPGMCSTRIQRGEWNDLTEELLHASPTYGSSVAADIDQSVEVATGSSPDADGYYDANLAMWDPITKKWTKGLPIFVRDMNA